MTGLFLKTGMDGHILSVYCGYSDVKGHSVEETVAYHSIPKWISVITTLMHIRIIFLLFVLQRLFLFLYFLVSKVYNLNDVFFTGFTAS